MICSIPGCGRTHYGRGWCLLHYGRWRRHGDPLAGRRLARPRGMTETETFAWYMPGDPPSAPSPTEGCWDWAGNVHSYGYGQFSVGARPIFAHRVSYGIYNGSVEGFFVLHSCDRPICVQPAHLHLGDHDDNMAEAVERGRFAVGEALPQAKLTEADVLWIRAQTDMTQRAMAEKLGVTRGLVGQIRRGTVWKHIPSNAVTSSDCRPKG